MTAAGLPVPPFFVIPAETVDLFLTPRRQAIEELIQNFRDGSAANLSEISSRIQNMILAIAFPPELAMEIQAAFEQLCEAGQFVAVRSSALAEDGIGASFAGQHATYLYVTADQLLSSIVDSIASAWSVGALSYRQAKGLPLHAIRYAVVIQQMVEATRSGIGFSMHQGGNLADAILVAGYGLGEGIVTDRVETDTYIINRQHGNIRQQCRPKYSGLAYQPGKGLVLQPLGAEPAQSPTLTEPEIRQVVELALQAEQLLQAPADVEFSFDQSGKLYLLQMRPITTIDLRQVEILDNTNIVESYPGISLPLTFSFARAAYEKVFTGSSRAFWVSDRVIRQQADIFGNLIAHYYGRIYYRLDNWYKMVSQVYSSSRAMAAWEKAVGLHHSEKGKVSFTLQNRLKTLASLIWLILNYRRGNRRFFNTFNSNYQQLRAIQPYLQYAKALWQHYEDTTARLFKPWYLTLVNDFLAFKFFGWLQDIIASYQLPDPGPLANDLLCGMGGVESETAVLHVLQLKEQILADPALKRLFEQSETEILDGLSQENFPEFQRMFHHHLDRYGDRTLAELKLEIPALRNDPAAFIRLLKNQLATPVEIGDFRRQQDLIRQQAYQQLHNRLHWWHPKTYLFYSLRKLAAYGLRNRENMRFCRTRAYGAVKDIFRAVGSLMEQAQVIEKQTDVFYLSLEQLRAFCLEGDRSIHRQTVVQLKAEYALFARTEPPERVIYQHGELPQLHEAQTWPNGATGTYQGIAVSKGRIRAEAAVVLDPAPQTQVHGKVLVSRMTDPGWVFLMMQAAGLISEKGSLLSHTAIVGRELGIPVVVGLAGATSIFKDGDLLQLDGSTGVVEKVVVGAER